MSLDAVGAVGDASGSEPRPEETELDQAALMAEINAEVLRRRASGDFPLGLERELDAMFARYAPAVMGKNFDRVLEQAEQASFIHADVPTASNRRAVAPVKRGLRKVMAFYVRFLAQEVTAFAGAITGAVRLLGQRVDGLEAMTVHATERSLGEVAQRRAPLDLSAWTGVVAGTLMGTTGRVLHTECGGGELLCGLLAAGIDAYGVEPSERLAAAAASAGLDVREGKVIDHLRALPDGVLGGLVLSAAVDYLPLGDIFLLADLAGAKLSPGGVVVIISAGLSGWSAADPVIADLSPGRPLHPETWLHLLKARSFLTPLVHASPAANTSLLLSPVPANTPGAEVLNANVERLNRLLGVPAAYAVTARRPA